VGWTRISIGTNWCGIVRISWISRLSGSRREEQRPDHSGESFANSSGCKKQRSSEERDPEMKKILSRRDPGSVRIFLSESDDTHKNPSMASFDLNAASWAAGRSWRNNSMSHRMAGRRPSTSQEYYSIRPTSLCTRARSAL